MSKKAANNGGKKVRTDFYCPLCGTRHDYGTEKPNQLEVSCRCDRALIVTIKGKRITITVPELGLEFTSEVRNALRS